MRATTVACPLGDRRRGDRVPARSMSPVVSRQRVVAVLVALLALTLSPAGSLWAQTVHGSVLDESNDVPVPGANVTLLARSGILVSQAIANDFGRFALEVPEAGEYFIQVQRLGYEPMMSLLLEIGVDRDYDLELVVRPAPVPIDEIRVTVRSQQVRRWVRQIIGMDPSSLGGCAKVMLDGAPFPRELFDTLDPYAIGALVFLRPIDSGVLLGPNLGASGTLLLFTEGYVAREHKP